MISSIIRHLQLNILCVLLKKSKKNDWKKSEYKLVQRKKHWKKYLKRNNVFIIGPAGANPRGLSLDLQGPIPEAFKVSSSLDLQGPIPEAFYWTYQSNPGGFSSYLLVQSLTSLSCCCGRCLGHSKIYSCILYMLSPKYIVTTYGRASSQPCSIPDR